MSSCCEDKKAKRDSPRRHSERSGSKNHQKGIYTGFANRRREMVSMDAPDIFYPLRDAVVSIYTQTTFSTGTTGQKENVSEVGTGFFVAKDTIVTAAHVVMVDNSSGYRDPSVPSAYSQFARCGKIFVRVNNVNRKCKSYFYEACLVGVSPSNDIAVIRIVHDKVHKCQPDLKNHPFLKWGCSRDTAIGEKTFVLADSLNSEAVGISQGIVVDNVYADNRLNSSSSCTYWGFEGILTDADSLPGNSGGPLLNSHGHVIGVISGLDGFGGVTSASGPLSGLAYSYRTIAVSEHIAHRIVDIICAGPCNSEASPWLQQIIDPLGNYYRFSYGWLGISGFEAFGPEMLRIVPDSKFRTQQGFVITSLDAYSPLNQLFQNIYSFPAGTPPAEATPANEIYVVTGIECFKLGVDSGQVPFSSVTTLYRPKCEVKIKYRIGSENFSCTHSSIVELGEFPLDEDLAPPMTATVSAINRNLDLSKLGDIQGKGFLGDLGKNMGIDLLRLLLVYGNDLVHLLNGHGETSKPLSIGESLEAALNGRTHPE